MKKWKKVLLGLFITLFILVTVVLFSISAIAKYAIEKYSVKYLGRQIKVGWVYLNPFTANVNLHNLKIYEHQSDSLFLEASSVSAGFATRKVFSKTYEITSLTLDNPRIQFVQNHNAFNLDDIIDRFTPKGAPDTLKGPLHFNLLNLKINNGEIHYREESIPVNYFVKEVNLESTGLRWDVDSIQGKVSLKSGPASGDLKADISINLKNSDYRIAAVVNKFDLKVIEQYLKDIANYGSFTASLDANIRASGNFKDQLNLTAAGFVGVNAFHFGKVPGEDYASFDKLAIDIIEASPKNYKYIIDTVMISGPFFKYERYDYLNNLERMFGKGGSKYSAVKADPTKFNLIVEVAKFLNVLAKNFVESYYKVNKVAVYNGDIKFSDFSLREKFAIAANPLNILIDSVDKNNERFTAHIRTAIKPYGYVSADVSVDPNDYGFFDISYGLKKLPVAMFNPYIVSYTSFPLDRGTLEFNGDFHAVNSVINSRNHLLIIDPRVSKRIKKKDTKWIPVPFLMSLVRNKGDVIDYEIPISGDLKSPKFHFWGIIGSVLANVFIKPPSTIYIVQVKKQETQIEKFLTLKWEIRQVELNPLQQKFITKMAKFLDETPEASMTITPIQYEEKEKEHIMFFEAKKIFFEHVIEKNKESLEREDSLKIDKMSVKDSAFVRYLDNKFGDTMMFTIQEKCLHLVGQHLIDSKFNRLVKARSAAFASVFEEYGMKDQSRVKINISENSIPFDGFSYYKINYKGDLPRNLLAAYDKMNELNQSPSRSKYEKDREKDGGVLIEGKEKK